MGTAVGTKVFLADGWRQAAALSVGWQVLCLIVMSLRGPHCRRYTWFGYEGGWSIRKVKVAPNDKEMQAEPDASVEQIRENVALEKGSASEVVNSGEKSDMIIE